MRVGVVDLGGAYVHEHAVGSYGHACRQRIDVRVDMPIDTCIDMHIDMHVDTCIAMRIAMRIDMHIDMHVDICIDYHRHGRYGQFLLEVSCTCTWLGTSDFRHGSHAFAVQMIGLLWSHQLGLAVVLATAHASSALPAAAAAPTAPFVPAAPALEDATRQGKAARLPADLTPTPGADLQHWLKNFHTPSQGETE